ncbi:MAG TPA: hypothetical protein DCW68_04695 [Rhodospirillaceae bacterium]|nr:MAG: hypothetical protein A2018_02950 [Alphaproteobacteria bacterium GWF2_58_20]HAU29394.1 hypothetical protein [Rhodospirillaceae bacterium]
MLVIDFICQKVHDFFQAIEDRDTDYIFRLSCQKDLTAREKEKAESILERHPGYLHCTNLFRYSAMFIATECGNKDMVGIILSVDPSHATDNIIGDGITPGHISVINNHTDITQILVDANPDVITAQDFPGLDTMGHLAVLKNRSKHVQIIIQANPAAASMRNSHDDTMESLAIANGNDEIVRLIKTARIIRAVKANTPKLTFG